MMKASRQWATRPNDERFTDLLKLNDHCQGIRHRSLGKVISSRRLQAVPVSNEELVIEGPNGVPADVTHWAFGQVCQRVKAQASYLRTLPAPLAADCLNYGLKFHREAEEIGILLTTGNASGDYARPELRAVTGPQYGRIWNHTITQALVNRFGDGITGEFRVPGEFGKQVDITKANTTLYAGDRDIFVFLADEERRIEVPNRRGGKSGSLARGFFLWNSEVGSTSFGLGMFLFDYVCMNRIVWGMQDYKEMRLRHTAAAPDRWIEEVAPAIEAYAHSSTNGLQDVLIAAQKKKVDDTDTFLKNRFTNTQVTGIKAAYFADEQRPLEDKASIWDMTTAVTAYARGIDNQDERVKMEREGGKILDLAA